MYNVKSYLTHIPLSSSSSLFLLFCRFLFLLWLASILSVFPLLSFSLFFPFDLHTLSWMSMSFNFSPFFCFLESLDFLFFFPFDSSSSLRISSSLSFCSFLVFLESLSTSSTWLSLSFSCSGSCTPLLLGSLSCGLFYYW